MSFFNKAFIFPLNLLVVAGSSLGVGTASLLRKSSVKDDNKGKTLTTKEIKEKTSISIKKDSKKEEKMPPAPKIEENFKGEYLLFDRQGKRFCKKGTQGGRFDGVKTIDCSKREGMKEYLKNGEQQFNKLGVKVKFLHDLRDTGGNGFLRLIGAVDILADHKIYRDPIYEVSFPEECDSGNRKRVEGDNLDDSGGVVSCSKKDN